MILGFSCGSAGKESTHNGRNLGWIPELGRSPGEGKGYPLQCSGLEKSSGKEPVCYCRGTKRWGFDPWVGEDSLEESMETHSNILA